MWEERGQNKIFMNNWVYGVCKFLHLQETIGPRGLWVIHGWWSKSWGWWVPPRKTVKVREEEAQDGPLCAPALLLWVWHWVSLLPWAIVKARPRLLAQVQHAFLCTGAGLKTLGIAATHHYNFISLLWWCFCLLGVHLPPEWVPC